jgi:UDP-glucose 4-epimerase
MLGKKVLITGGHGNLGLYIVSALVNLGCDVFVLSRKKDKLIEKLKYTVIDADIVSATQLREKLNFDIDYCIHLASYNEYFLENYPKKALEVNTLGTRNLLEALNIKKLKNFIYFSTFHVYGLNSGMIDENTAPNPKNDYASTHLFAEYFVKQFGFTHGLKYTILRLTNSYGVPFFKDTDKWYLILNNLVKDAIDDKIIKLKSNGEIHKDFVSMVDVARIVNTLLTKNASNEIFNLSSGQAYSLLELAKLIQEQYRKKYNENIEISINSDDKNNYKRLDVDNRKLLNFIDFNFKDIIDNEVNNIFTLLEDA